MKNTLLIAAALLTIGGTSAAIAGEPLQSPRAKDTQIRVVQTEARVAARVLGGRADRSTIIVATPRHADQLNAARKVKSAGPILTSYHGPAGSRLLSPRAAEQVHAKEIQVAPIK